VTIKHKETALRKCLIFSLVDMDNFEDCPKFNYAPS